ncbi:MAG: hypothetical protein AAB152_12525 [Candidatus Coatesbacteria bacterium]
MTDAGLCGNLAMPVVLVGMIFAAAGVGGTVIGMLRLPGEPVRTLLVGLGVAGSIMWGAGLCGLLFPLAAWTLVAVGIACGLFRWRAIHSTVVRLPGAEWRPNPELAVAAVVTTGLAVAGVLMALPPPTSFDTLNAHLYLPGQFVLLHKIVGMPSFFISALSPLIYAQSSWAILLEGSWRGAGIANWVYLPLGAAAVFRLGRELGSGAAASLAASAGWMATPLVLMESSTPMTDLQPAVYVILIAGEIGTWLRERSTSRLALIAGLAAMGLASKYTAGPAIVLLMAGIPLASGRMGRRLRRTGLLAGMTVIACLPFLLRSLAIDGAPLYPLLTHSRQNALLAANSNLAIPVVHSLWTAMVFPAEAALHPELVLPEGIWPPGAALLGLYLFPLVAFLIIRKGAGGRRGHALAWLIMGTSLILYAAGLTLRWPLRYQLPLFAFCIVLLMGIADRIRWAPALVLAGLLAAATPQLAGAWRPFTHFARCGFNDDIFLSTAPPTSWWYPAIRALHDAVPGDRRAINFMEPRVAFADLRLLASSGPDRSVLEEVVEGSRTIGDALGRLDRLGISHLLLNTRPPAIFAQQYLSGMNPRQRALLTSLLADGVDVVWSSPQSPCRVLRFRHPRRRARPDVDRTHIYGTIGP